ncbi:prepilin peptidase [Polynucleobacter antarcticus]|uniref:Prepilin peptidase n=1 Tax=Polynucleobacter antarcticus TaxID=1743162 RepID=A0A6M9Q0R1_9BURK|nr:A24 family peptidase [Polynucleobacter antarcticus]QKM61773.1 prepilin peptidase [Polynucleobacter antarcticus]
MDSMIIYLIKASLVAAFTYLAYVDWHSFRLPNRITLPLIVLGMTFNGLFEQQFVSATSAWIGAVVGYGSLWALNATYRLVRGKNGVGMGDAKLLAALGAWLGWESLPSILLMASILGLIGGIAWLRWHRQQLQQAFPFGPFLAIAGIIELLWPQIIPTLIIPRLI